MPSSDDEVPDVKESHQPRLFESKAMELGQPELELSASEPSASLPIQSDQDALTNI